MGKKSNFTIVEMLTIIVIISILAAFLLPALTTVRHRARKTEAKVLMNAISTAVKSYESTYGVLPVTSSSWSNSATSSTYSSQYNTLISVLTNLDTEGNTGKNTRNIRFLDVPKDYIQKGYVDPWNNKFRVYIDTNYDGIILKTALESGTPLTEDLYGTVFLYSTSGESDNSDVTYSWK